MLRPNMVSYWQVLGHIRERLTIAVITRFIRVIHINFLYIKEKWITRSRIGVRDKIGG